MAKGANKPRREKKKKKQKREDKPVSAYKQRMDTGAAAVKRHGGAQ